jgi:hypothetical protein
MLNKCYSQTITAKLYDEVFKNVRDLNLEVFGCSYDGSQSRENEEGT